MFPGDSGFRLLYASQIIVRLGSRIWLPYLQTHIYLFHLIKAPLLFFQLIPVVYFLVFLWTINQLAIKLVGISLKAKLFTLLLLLVLVSNRLLLFLSHNLYQEVPVLALFYLLTYLWLFSQKRSWLFCLVGILALFTREYFWILYLTLGIVNLREYHKLSKPKIIIYSLLGMLPLSWMALTSQTTTLNDNATATVFTLAAFAERTLRLTTVLATNAMLPILFCLLVVWLVIVFYKKPIYHRRYLWFSLLSWLFFLSYTLLKDPWQPRPENPRMVIPFIMFIPIWTLLAYQAIQNLPKRAKNVLVALLCTGLILLCNQWPSLNAFLVKANVQIEPFVAALRQYREQQPNQSLKIAVVAMDFWEEYVPYFSGMLLYENKEYLKTPPQNPDQYDLIFKGPLLRKKKR